MAKRTFPIDDNVPHPPVGKKQPDPAKAALDRDALAAFKRGDFPSKRQAAEAFLSSYYGEWATQLPHDEREDKIKYIVRRLAELERRTSVSI
ncbi:hypothetical protein [Oceaniradius stylonematis]|uniref:hypothetical protein n=1 Tax=Oceaniradius stylonematis TaxID=2184161 RepID=UPI00273E5B9B|nr:hypothetical protein [Oceaniradius stylonematis]